MCAARWGAEVDLRKLQLLEPLQFEELVKAVFERMGYQVEMTHRSRDQGVDLVLTRTQERSIVQCRGIEGKSVNLSLL